MYAETVTEGATMTDAVIGNLGDIPDLSGMEDNASTEWADGWYQGTILEKREFTDQNGSDRVFESQDIPSANGESRNIRLQVEIKRQDNRTLNTSVMVNYRPEDLSPETIQAITAHKETGEKWGNLFRPFMVLNRLSKLQKIAGVSQLQRNGDGGLNIQPLYGKTAYFKLGPDERSGGKYKEVVDFRATRPTKATVL